MIHFIYFSLFALLISNLSIFSMDISIAQLDISKSQPKEEASVAKEKEKLREILKNRHPLRFNPQSLKDLATM